MTITLRRTLTLLAAVTIAVASLAACGDDDGGSSDVPNLDGTWALDSSALDPSINAAFTDETRPNLIFAGERVNGFGGCNQYNGSVTYDDKKMEFSDLAQTAMACPDPAGAIESAYMTALNSVRFYEKTGTTLRMMDDKSQVVLTFGSA